MKLMSSRRAGAIRTRLIIALVIPAALLAGFLLLRKSRESLPPDLTQRPADRKLLFDYAGILRLQDEAVESYLMGIRNHQKIETMIVTLPSLAGFRTIQEAASKLMTDWKIGDKFGNKGILLLLAAAEKEVKMEVTYELEDVFTDLFTGTVEDQQLKPHLLAGDLGSGMVAVMEVMEERAEIKHLGSYTPKMIADLDAQYASGGAGARKQLDSYAEAKQKSVAASILSPGSSIFTDSSLLSMGRPKDPRYPAGKTPEAAYDIMRAAFSQDPASREALHFKRTEGIPYEVLRTETRAVIYFGDKQDWDYAPFLFAKFPDGWKFDMVNQGLYVRYGNAPYWAIERGDHDYMDLLGKFRGWMDIDIPWEERDIYRVEQDSQLVAEILRLEELYRNNPDDFDTALELGRLGVITGRRLNLVVPRLEKAKSLRPDDPAPYKYLAIDYVTFSFQYKKAIALMEEMLKRDPGSLFGRKFLGYIYFQAGDSISAEKNLRAALEIDPSDCYALTKLGRIFTDQFKQSGLFEDRKTAVELYKKSKSGCAQNPKRAIWFRNNLSYFPLPSAFLGSNFFGHSYEGQGVVVSDVMPDGPAARGGLQDGDFIMSIDGIPIFDDYEFAIFIGGHQPGEKAELEIVRGALAGPVTVTTRNITIIPRTAGLNPPKRLKIEVTFGNRENARSMAY